MQQWLKSVYVDYPVNQNSLLSINIKLSFFKNIKPFTNQTFYAISEWCSSNWLSWYCIVFFQQATRLFVAESQLERL